MNIEQQQQQTSNDVGREEDKSLDTINESDCQSAKSASAVAIDDKSDVSSIGSSSKSERGGRPVGTNGGSLHRSKLSLETLSGGSL